MTVADSAMAVQSGVFVDLERPDPETIVLQDVARALGYTCRFGGHVERYYSVAEHSILVRDLLRSLGFAERIQTRGLFHDAAEAYLGDVVSPLRRTLRRVERIPSDDYQVGAYERLMARMESAIAEAFGLDLSQDGDVVRTADLWALRIESRELTTSRGSSWIWPDDLPNDGKLPEGIRWFGGYSPSQASFLWLREARKALGR